MIDALSAQVAAGEFEALCEELLSFQGMVAQEQLVGHKKADRVLTTRRFGKTLRTAVECKHWRRRVTQRELAVIYAEYLPLLQSAQVDDLLLVTAAGLAPSAETMIAESRDLSHLTITELQREVIDFDAYLRSLIDEYDLDPKGLPAYFVEMDAEGGEPLRDVVDGWLDAPEGRPLAIVGAYGLGKTSFARRLAHDLAAASLSSAEARVPIVVKLGDVSSEQRLENILGGAMTATGAVRDFSFPAFRQLNRAGRFVLILDGFDEMRHVISRGHLRVNFAEINRLVEGDSRVLVLGRPTAFTSDEEQEELLHGRRRVAGQLLAQDGWPDYREVRIAPLRTPQITTFLGKYLRANPQRTPRATDHAIDTLVARVERRIRTGKLLDVAKRPVQLQMLAEILPQWKGDLDALDVFGLYDHFIDRVIERDTAKRDLSRLNVAARRRFAADLALWMWQERRRIAEPDAIPPSIVAANVTDAADGEGELRSLLSGCFLDRRPSGGLVFPHRSFQEFLVGEKLAAELAAPPPVHVDVASLDALLTKDVAAFLQAHLGRVDAGRVLEKLLPHTGRLSTLLAPAFEQRLAALEQLLHTTGDSPWPILLLAHAAPERLEARLLLAEMRAQPADERGLLPALVLLTSLLMMSAHTRIDASVRDALIVMLKMRLRLTVPRGEILTSDRRVPTRLDPSSGEPVEVERIPDVARHLAAKIGVSTRLGTIDLRGVLVTLGGQLNNHAMLFDPGEPHLPAAGGPIPTTIRSPWAMGQCVPSKKRSSANSKPTLLVSRPRRLSRPAHDRRSRPVQRDRSGRCRSKVGARSGEARSDRDGRIV